MNEPLLLIVDDEFGVRESLKMVFSKDFRVQDADSIEAAMSKVEAEGPQVVLLDVLMPRSDGIEVLKQIKKTRPDCQVIMLTALNTERTALVAREAGAFDYVIKPFDVGELRLKVQRALEKSLEKTKDGTA